MLQLREWVGPCLVVHSVFVKLHPKFITTNSLLLQNDLATNEQTCRAAHATAVLIALALEIMLAHKLPHRAKHAALALTLAGLVSALHAICAFGIIGHYSFRVALLLQTTYACCVIPANHCTAQWRLGQRNPPIRFTILGWILVVSMGTAVLLIPRIFANAIFVAILLSSFPILLGLLLLKGTTVKEDVQMIEADNEYTIELGCAMFYLLVSCVIGTNAESLNDCMLNYRVRSSLSRGSTRLAMSNNLSILSAQTLALIVECAALGRTKPKNDHKRYILFHIIWSLSQVLRAVCLYIFKGQEAPIILSCIVFLDKYTGPLGEAALDAASVSLLQSSMSSSKQYRYRWSKFLTIPATTLLSIRGMTSRFERPLWDVLLLTEDEWPYNPTTVVLFMSLSSTILLTFLLSRLGALSTEIKSKVS